MHCCCWYGSNKQHAKTLWTRVCSTLLLRQLEVIGSYVSLSNVIGTSAAFHRFRFFFSLCSLLLHLYIRKTFSFLFLIPMQEKGSRKEQPQPFFCSFGYTGWLCLTFRFILWDYLAFHRVQLAFLFYISPLISFIFLLYFCFIFFCTCLLSFI